MLKTADRYCIGYILRTRVAVLNLDLNPKSATSSILKDDVIPRECQKSSLEQR